MSQENLRAGIERLNESLDPKNSGIDTGACVAQIEAGIGDP